jgi:hypothetical protein
MIYRGTYELLRVVQERFSTSLLFISAAGAAAGYVI